jgi:hypothetical protein
MFAGTQCSTPDQTTSVEILVDGTPQPLYHRPSDGAMFVEALVGSPYAVRVTNSARARVEALLAVDGRNTQADEPADLNSRGLVMYGSCTFSGWRSNNKTVNTFVFSAPKRSIAGQAGSANNVGVIGLAVYSEQQQVRLMGGFEGGFEGGLESMGDAPSPYSVTIGGSVGTGMGGQVADHVGTTTFTRDGAPPSVLVIRYDTRKVLEQMGLLVPGEPNPFPGSDAFGKYGRV